MSDNRISIPQIRQLKELERELDLFLNEEEFLMIASVYNKTCNRLLKEAEESEEKK